MEASIGVAATRLATLTAVLPKREQEAVEAAIRDAYGSRQVPTSQTVQGAIYTAYELLSDVSPLPALGASA